MFFLSIDREFLFATELGRNMGELYDKFLKRSSKERELSFILYFRFIVHILNLSARY